MGKIVLFAIPKVEPVRPWCPTEADIKRYGRDLAQQLQWSSEISRQIDNSTREKVAVLVSVLGMKDLANLCVDCALAEIIKLCGRPDVNALLDAYRQREPIPETAPQAGHTA
jgi:hypothetical protein